LTFALGLGFLLMLLGIFSGVLSSLPRAGRWMNVVKKGFGAAMLVIGGWFIFHAVMMWTHSGSGL
jgi:thiol:disulfide interchange protein DsbD